MINMVIYSMHHKLGYCIKTRSKKSSVHYAEHKKGFWSRICHAKFVVWKGGGGGLEESGWLMVLCKCYERCHHPAEGLSIMVLARDNG